MVIVGIYVILINRSINTLPKLTNNPINSNILTTYNDFISPKKKGTYKKRPKIYCNDYLMEIQPSREWYYKTREFIITRLNNISIDYSGEYIADEVAKVSGIGVFRGRKYRNFNNNFYNKPPFTQSIVTPLDYSIEKKILDILSSRFPLDGLMKYKDLNFKNRYFLNQGDPKFLLGLMAKYQNNELLEYILERNISIFYSDLAELTALGFPLSIVKKAYFLSGLSASEKLKGAFSYTSLANIALESKQFELAIYWIEQGSPLQPDNHSINGLDILLNKRKILSDNEFKSLFEIINKKIAFPYSKNSNVILSAFLKEKNIKFNQKILNINELVPENRLIIDKLVNALHQYVIGDLLREKIKNDNLCFSILGRFYTNLALFEFKESPLTNKIKKSDLIAEVKSVKKMFDSYEEAIEFLGNERSYKSKKMVYLLKIEQLKESHHELISGNKDEHLTILIQHVIKLASQGLWTQALKLLETTGESKGNVLSTLLYIAIYQNTDFSIIESILQKGGILSPITIVNLIQQNNIILANKLLPFGLNINITDPMGYSSNALAVKYKSFDMLKFLLANGATINFDSTSYDALDVALLEFKKNELMLPYITILIEYGYIAGLSQQQIVEELKTSNFWGYTELIKKFPFFEL